MREIKLTRGFTAIVDDEDYDRVMSLKWHASEGKPGWNYAVSSCGKRMHRFLLNPDSDDVIDHINHDTLDNRRSNLRVVSHSMNCQNRKKCTSASGYFGVRASYKPGRWDAYVFQLGDTIRLGSFPDKESAAKARDLKVLELFGPGARLNFPLKQD
jgi:hypothetical protein